MSTTVFATEHITRINYGVRFKKLGTIQFSSQTWEHIFHVHKPGKTITLRGIQDEFMLYRKAYKDNIVSNTSILNSSIELNALEQLNNTIVVYQTVTQRLDTLLELTFPDITVPKRQRRSFLDLSYLSEHLFGIAGVKDVQNAKARIARLENQQSASAHLANAIENLTTISHIQSDTITRLTQQVNIDRNRRLKQLQIIGRIDYKIFKTISLLQAIESSIHTLNQLIRETEQFTNSLTQIVMGELPTPIIPPKEMIAALKNISAILLQQDSRYQLETTRIADLYKQPKFLAYRVKDIIHVVLYFNLIPIGMQTELYSIDTIQLPVPGKNNDMFSSIIPKYDEFLVYEPTSKSYTFLNAKTLTSCSKSYQLHQITFKCDFPITLEREQTPNCLYFLFMGDMTLAAKHCKVQVKSKTAQPSITQLGENEYMIVNLPRVKLQCTHDKTVYIAGCSFCVLSHKVPCKCTISDPTKEMFPVFQKCKYTGTQSQINTTFPLNFGIIKEFFNKRDWPAFENVNSDKPVQELIQIPELNKSIKNTSTHDILSTSNDVMNVDTLARAVKSEIQSYHTVAHRTAAMTPTELFTKSADPVVITLITIVIVQSVVTGFHSYKLFQLLVMVRLIKGVKSQQLQSYTILPPIVASNYAFEMSQALSKIEPIIPFIYIVVVTYILCKVTAYFLSTKSCWDNFNIFLQLSDIRRCTITFTFNENDKTLVLHSNVVECSPINLQLQRPFTITRLKVSTLIPYIAYKVLIESQDQLQVSTQYSDYSLKPTAIVTWRQSQQLNDIVLENVNVAILYKVDNVYFHLPPDQNEHRTDNMVQTSFQDYPVQYVQETSNQNSHRNRQTHRSKYNTEPPPVQKRITRSQNTANNNNHTQNSLPAALHATDDIPAPQYESSMRLDLPPAVTEPTAPKMPITKPNVCRKLQMDDNSQTQIIPATHSVTYINPTYNEDHSIDGLPLTQNRPKQHLVLELNSSDDPGQVKTVNTVPSVNEHSSDDESGNDTAVNHEISHGKIIIAQVPSPPETPLADAQPSRVRTRAQTALKRRAPSAERQQIFMSESQPLMHSSFTLQSAEFPMTPFVSKVKSMANLQPLELPPLFNYDKQA